MPDWQTNMKSLAKRDELYRAQMQRASDALLQAMVRELEAMGLAS